MLARKINPALDQQMRGDRSRMFCLNLGHGSVRKRQHFRRDQYESAYLNDFHGSIGSTLGCSAGWLRGTNRVQVIPAVRP